MPARSRAIAHRVRHRIASAQQGFEILHAGRHLAVIGVHQRQAVDLLRQCDRDRRERLVDQQHLGAAVAHRILVFKLAPADVERDHDASRPSGGQIDFEIAIGVQRQNRDTVAGVDAECPEAGGKTRHALAGLAPGAPPCTENRRQPIGIDLQDPAQSMRDVHFRPPLAGLLFLVGDGLRFRAGALASPSVS